MFRRFDWPALVLIVAWGPHPDGASAQPKINAGVNDEIPVRTDSDTADVYLDDSFAASDAIGEARRLARAGQWAEAAELLQRTADAAEGKLVRHSPGYYVGIRGYINQLIAAWPEAGIRAYRALFDPRMRAALEDVSDRRSTDELLKLFDRYFCTVTAAEVANRIGQLAIERGDFALAERVYERVLEDHPDRAEYRVRYRPMLALVQVMSGQDPATLREFDENALVHWMGVDRPAGEIVTEIREHFANLWEPPSPLDWPIFGGDAARNRPTACPADELGLLWRHVQSTEPKPDGGRWDSEGSLLSGPGDLRHASVHPVVTEDTVYAQFYREIIALRRRTGTIAWRYRPDEAASPGFRDFEDQPPGWDAPTECDGRIYAVLPGDAVPHHGYESTQIAPELVCLDAATGDLIWPQDREAFVEQFIEVRFDSSPIVQQGRLYVVGRRRRSFGFEDCYLFRFNAADGRLEQRTHLGSGSTGTFGSQRATLAIPALHRDTVYVCTNLGTIAAVSAHSGAVRWLRLYERDTDELRRASGLSTPVMDSWTFNPVFWSEGRIASLPTDGPNVLVLADDDGRTLHSIPIGDMGGVQTLLGLRGNLICGVGREAACLDLIAGTSVWTSPLPVGGEIRGRGVWVDDRLLVPTRDRLSSFRVSDGTGTDLPWDTGGMSGNLVALPDQLLVAGAGMVSAYVRKEDIWQDLRKRMAAAPSDPLPALELAEVAMQGGEWTAALEVLEEAARRTGGFLGPLDPPFQRRCFDDMIRFLNVLFSRAALEINSLEKLCSYAGRCAPDAAAHTVYRFRCGELYEELGEPNQALQLYQQILRDRSLREEADITATTGSVTAGGEAHARIMRLVDRVGAEVYAPFEAEARQWLERAGAAKDEAALRRITETFPNSDAAPRALIALGELAAADDRPRQAAAHFARAYQSHPKKVDRPLLLRRIADAYEQSGQLETAYRWLTKAMREHPGVHLEHAGRQITFREYRERLSAAGANVAPGRPCLQPPLSRHFVKELGEGAALLVPWFGTEPNSDWSRYYVYGSGEIRAYESPNHTEVWPAAAAVLSPPELLVATSDVAVFATKYQVFGLDPATGRRHWSHGDYPADPVEIAGEWEGGTGFRTHAVEGDRLVSVREDGLMTCVAVDDGQLVWSAKRRPVPVGQLRLASPRLAYHVLEDGRTEFHLLDVADGKGTGVIRVDEPRPAEDFFLTLDGQLIAATLRSLAAYDVETGRKRWQVPLDGHLRSSTLRVDLDALYLSDDGRSVRKITLENGAMCWQSEDLVRRGEQDLTVQLHDGNVIVSTAAAIAAVDAVTGLTLWQGTTPDLPRFASRLLTQSYVLAIDVRNEVENAPSTAYFYDLRNASGRIPRDGGACDLGALDGVRETLIVNGALLIQTGSTIRGWTE